MTAMHSRWGGPADGPYVHVDEVLAYFEENATKFKDKGTSSAALAAEYFDQIHTIFSKWAANERKKRLDLVAGTAPATIADLVDLRDELSEGP